MTIEQRRKRTRDIILALNKNRWAFLQKAMEDFPEKFNKAGSRSVNLVTLMGHPIIGLVIQTSMTDLLILSGLLTQGKLDGDLDDIVAECRKSAATLKEVSEEVLPDVDFNFDFTGLEEEEPDASTDDA